MTYAELDQLFVDRKTAIGFVALRIDDLKSRTCSEILYSAYSNSFLGNEMPSVFLKDERRFFKKKPAYRQWNAYAYDADGNILSVSSFQRIDQAEICDCTYYFFQKDGYHYAVPCIGNSNKPYPSYTFKYRFEGSKIVYVAYITSADSWLELYDWEKESCEVWHYVPNRTDSDRNAPIGSEQSPAYKSIQKLNVMTASFSPEAYLSWLTSCLDQMKEKRDVYISVSERFSSEYSIDILAEDGMKDVVVSNPYIFSYKKGWKQLLNQLKRISKEAKTSNIANRCFIGFCDGDFEQIF